MFTYLIRQGTGGRRATLTAGTRLRELTTAVAAVTAGLLACATASPAMAATVSYPHHGSPVPVPPAQVAAQIQTATRTVLAGGMPGWQITMIAVGAALLTVTMAVLADWVRAARRRVIATAARAVHADQPVILLAGSVRGCSRVGTAVGAGTMVHAGRGCRSFLCAARGLAGPPCGWIRTAIPGELPAEPGDCRRWVIDRLSAAGLRSRSHVQGLSDRLLQRRGDHMAGAAARPVPGRPRWLGRIWNRELDAYPDTAARVLYLAITVLATITLYYLLYVDSSVATLELVNLHMSFTFFVLTRCFGALIGAFGSLFAGLADRFGRANLVVFGLLFAGVFVAFIIPAATSKWAFTIEWSAVGFVEGVCLVAAPALIRDFSPQVGRATAMGFWTTGPTMGSLIVAVVGTVTIPAVVIDPRFWTHEYRIGGAVGLVVCVIAFVGLRELSPQLRDQLMVTMRDRALIEARAKGLSEADIEAALRHPFRQLFKPDIVVSAVAVSVMLLGYFTAVGFSVI